MKLLRTLLALSTFLACSSCTHQQQVQLHTVADYGNVACAVVENTVDNPVVDFVCNVIDQVDNNTPKKVTMHLARPAAFKLGLIHSPTTPAAAPPASVSPAPSSSR